MIFILWTFILTAALGRGHQITNLVGVGVVVVVSVIAKRKNKHFFTKNLLNMRSKSAFGHTKHGATRVKYKIFAYKGTKMLVK